MDFQANLEFWTCFTRKNAGVLGFIKWWQFADPIKVALSNGERCPPNQNDENVIVFQGGNDDEMIQESQKAQK